MTDWRPSWTDLNAYVDGELPAAEAARVAREVARDSALADRVAALTQLKAAAQEGAEAAVPAELSGILDRCAPRGGNGSRPRPWRRAALGALAAAFALVLVGGMLLTSRDGGLAAPAWRNLALRLHDDWAGAAAEADDWPSAGVLLASLSRLGRPAQVPDLSAARLTLAYLKPVSFEASEGFHVGYRGTRGCRVSLMIFAEAAGLPREPAPLAGAGPQAYAWRAGALGYALLASGMDPPHYQVVLKSVYEASRKQRPLDQDTRTALADSRAHSRPCAG